MRNKITVLITLCVIFLLFGSVFAEEIGEWWKEEGEAPFTITSDSPLLSSYPGGLVVDWGRKAAIMTGSSAVSGPMTVENREKIRKLAENRALDGLITSIGLVRVNSFTKLSDLLDNKYGLRASISDLIRKTHRIVHEKVYKDAGVFEITIEFDLSSKRGLSGTLISVLLSDLESPTPSVPKAFAETSEAYTGLIVDASGLGIEGGLCPTIVSDDGREIYSLKRDIDKSAFITDGFSDYVLAESQSSEEVSRAGSNPLLIGAKNKLKGPYDCDIVIPSSEAEKMIEADRSSGFLKKLKVVILL